MDSCAWLLCLHQGQWHASSSQVWQLQSFSEHIPLESLYWVKVTFESNFSSLYLVFSLPFLSHLLRPLLLMTFKSSVHWSPSAPSEEHFYFWEVLDCTFRRWGNPQISYSWLYHSFSSLHLMVEDCSPKLASPWNKWTNKKLKMPKSLSQNILKYTCMLIKSWENSSFMLLRDWLVSLSNRYEAAKKEEELGGLILNWDGQPWRERSWRGTHHFCQIHIW